MNKLWNKGVEKIFFNEALKFCNPEQLFYVTNDNKYLAYWPKGYEGEKSTLQSRNSLIGKFTEKWTADLLKNVIKEKKIYAVVGAICEEIALTKMSPADVAISTNNNIVQKPEDILAIIEVKMSVVWNWEFKKSKVLNCIGDYRQHSGNPGLLRSDTMLKAIGKSINIRVSSLKAAKIPIIIMGNTPITDSYCPKVDQLKISGIVQGFWSINPIPLDDGKENIKKTLKEGFYRFDNINELSNSFNVLLKEEQDFFSSMKNRKELGRIIEIANKENTYEKKAEMFLKLIRE